MAIVEREIGGVGRDGGAGAHRRAERLRPQHPSIRAAKRQHITAGGRGNDPAAVGKRRRREPAGHRHLPAGDAGLGVEARKQLVASDHDQPGAHGGRLRRHEIDRPANRAAVQIDGHEAAALERHVGSALVDGGGGRGCGVEVDLEHRLQHEILVGASALHRCRDRQRRLWQRSAPRRRSGRRLRRAGRDRRRWWLRRRLCRNSRRGRQIDDQDENENEMTEHRELRRGRPIAIGRSEETPL